MTIDLKTLSEMPSTEEWRLKLSKRPRRSTTSTTVTAVGSPLTDPNGVKEGRYSYSRTGGIEPTEMISEHTGVPGDTSKTISSIKGNDPMTRREELETKGVSQLMAERFAEGVPRGAYSENSFEKGGDAQDLSTFKNMAKQYSKDNYENEIKDTLDRTRKNPAGSFNTVQEELDDLEEIIRGGEWATDAESDAISKFLRILGKDDRRELASKLRNAIESGDGDHIGETAYNVGAGTGYIPGGDKDDYHKAIGNLDTESTGQVDQLMTEGEKDAEKMVPYLPESIRDRIIPSYVYKNAIEMERQPAYGKEYTDWEFGNVKKDIQNRLNKKS